VTFRILSDSDDEIRTDQITLEEVKTFGYNINQKVDDFYDDEDEDDVYLFGDIDDEDLDEQEVISFLNEYYLIYPDNLPDAELY
jgi:hypothetical protein